MAWPETSVRKPSPRPWTDRNRKGRSRLLHQLAAGDGFQILVEDLVAGRLVEIEFFEDPQGLARIHGAVLRIERAVGREQDLLGRIELQAAFGRQLAAE